MKFFSQKSEPLRSTLALRRLNCWPRLTAAELNFHYAVSVWLIACAVLWMAGHIIARLMPAALPDMANLRSLFVPWAARYVTPEPQERRMYIVLTFACPIGDPGCLGSRAPGGSQKHPHRFYHGQVEVSDWTVAGVALAFCFGGTSLYLALSAHIMANVFVPITAGAFLPVSVAVLLIWWLLGSRGGRRWRRVTKAWRAIVLVGALALALVAGVALRIYDYSSATQTNIVHLNTALYPIAQVANGGHILVDFVPQYGCYAEFLKPLFVLIGFSVFRMTATLAVLQGLSLAAIIFALAQWLHSRLLLALTAGGLAWLMHVWFQFHFATIPFSPGTPFVASDPYFQYYPIRLLFPAWSLLGIWWYLRRPSRVRAASFGVLGGLAVWWNADTGTVVVASILILLAVKACSERGVMPPARRWQTGWHLLTAGSAAVLALVGFYFILCLDAGRGVDLAGVLHYQQIFYISGFFMVPMPTAFSLWHLVVGLYLLGLTHGLYGIVVGRPLTVHNGGVLYLSVLGLGLFSYYQGRSVEDVLMLCDWPAVALAALLCDRLFAATRAGLLPRLYSTAALPALALLITSATCLWLARGNIVATEAARWKAHTEKQTTQQTDAVGYLKRSVRHGESSAVISPFQAIYAAATGQRSGLLGPSIYECLLQTDLQSLRAQLLARRVQHLFTEPVVYPPDYGHPLGTGFFETLHTAYRAVGRNSEGNLLHWEPRSDGELGAYPREFAAQQRLNISPSAVRHAVRFAAPNVLLDAQEQCVAYPYDWGTVTFGSDFAIEMIVTPTAKQPDFACLISNHPGQDCDGLTVQRDTLGPGDTYTCSFGDGHQFTASVPFALHAGQEHYIVISSESKQVAVYLDGQLQGQLILGAPVAPSTTTLTIGNWVGGNRRFAGDIAEVKIHDHALPTDAVIRAWQQIFSGPKSGFTLPGPLPSSPVQVGEHPDSSRQPAADL